MSTSTETHLVANLKKYTKYEFFVAPFYRSVEGQPSNSKVVQTFEDGEFIYIFPLDCGWEGGGVADVRNGKKIIQREFLIEPDDVDTPNVTNGHSSNIELI